MHELKELDALAAKYVAGLKPKIYWEDSADRFRFESAREAQEALCDPWLRTLITEGGSRLPATIKEVWEFPCFSTDQGIAWSLIEMVPALAFKLSRSRGTWTASFGEYSSPAVNSAPLAICVAALKAVSIEVHIEIDGVEGPGGTPAVLKQEWSGVQSHETNAQSLSLRFH